MAELSKVEQVRKVCRELDELDAALSRIAGSVEDFHAKQNLIEEYNSVKNRNLAYLESLIGGA